MTGLPAIGNAVIPAEVRKGGDAEVDRYKTALGFERMLVSQLLKTSNLDLGAGPYSANASEALADSIAAGGGTGLADDLYRALKEAA